MPARHFVELRQETSFGVPIAVGDRTLNTNAIVPRLDGANQFTPLMKPVTQVIPGGGGYNSPACIYADTYAMSGNLQGMLYPVQTKFLMDWATTRINSARTTPWTTTDSTGVMPVGDLASISGYRAVLEASTLKRRRASGLKAQSFALQMSRQSPAVAFSSSVVGIRDDTNAAGTVADPDATEFPEPAGTDYPCGPWLFSHLAGGLKIGSSRTLFDMVNVTFTNTLQVLNWESRYPLMIGFYGRTITIEVGLYRKPTPDDLASFRALTALDVELTLANGTNTLTMDFGTKGRWTEMNEDLPLDNAYRWTGTITILDDAGTDFAFTYA